MKKISTLILILLMILALAMGCTPSEEPIVEDNIDGIEIDIEEECDIEELLEDIPEELPEEPSEEEVVIEGRPFDIAPGDPGFYAVRFLEHMNDYLPYRVPFTTRELEAAHWIADTLLDMGFYDEQVEIQSFRYDVVTSSWWGGALLGIRWFDEQGYYDGLEWIDYSQNVILTIPGRSDETIVIGAHYDSLAYAGISDNAASVALLLETAYRMQDYDHYYTLQFVFFGAEEVGLIGAFYFVDRLTATEVDNLVLAVNADVIVEGPVFVYATASISYLPEEPGFVLWGSEFWPTLYYCSFTMEIDDIANALVDDDIHLVAIPEAIFSPTDHLAFLELGIPTLYLYGTYDPVYPDFFVHNILHTPNDNLDFIMTETPGRIEDAFRTFVRFLEGVLLIEQS